MNRYLVALLVTSAAVLFCLGLGELLGPTAHPFVALFCGAAVAAAWYGGFRAGLLSTALGCLAVWYLFTEPRYSFRIERADDLVPLLTYAAAGLLGSWLCESLHAARRRVAGAVAVAEHRESEERLRLTLEAASVGGWWWTAEAGDTSWDSRFHAGYGFEPHEPKSFEAWVARLHPDDRQRVLDRVERMRATPGDDRWEMEFRTTHPRLGVRWHFGLGRCERDAAGRISRLYGIDLDITDRKLAEGKLSDSEHRLRLAVEAAATGLWEWDTASNAVTWSPECYPIHGLREGEFDGTAAGFDRLVHPDDRGRVWATVRAAVDDRTKYECEFRIVRPDGAVRWVANLGRAVYDGLGRPVRMVGTLTDITDRKQAEERVRASEQFNRSLMDGSADCVKVLDTGGRLLLMNQPGMCLMEIDDFGPLCGREWAAVWPADAGDDVRRAVATAAGGGVYTFEAFCPTARGTPKWWEVITSPVREADGGPVVRLLSVSRDITARKRAEERVRLGAEVAGLGVVQIDYAADTATPDATAAALFGLVPGVAVPRSAVHARFHPDDRDDIMGRMRQGLDPTGGGGFSIEHRVVRPDGSIRWLNVKKQVAFGEVGGVRRPVSAVLAAVDVTARKEAEDERRRAEGQYRSIVEGNPALICRFHPDGRLLFVNDTYCRTFNRSRESLVGHRFVPLVPDEDRPAVARLLDHLSPDMALYTLEHRVVLPDGQTRWQRWTIKPVADTGGAGVEYLAIGFDITDRKRAEERQRLLSEAAVALLATDEPDAMLRGLFARIAPALELDVYINYMADPEEECLRLASAHGITGDQQRELARMGYGQAVCGWVASNRTPYHARYVRQSDDPKEGVVRGIGLRAYACHPLLSGGVLLGTLAFGSRSRDCFPPDELDFLHTICTYVTAAYERLRLVNQLREADRKKDEFLATLAHELRNPLAPIRNGVQVMKLAGGNPEAVEKSRTMIERQVDQMARLIDDLMDLSRISRGKIVLQKTRMRLAAAVQNAVDTSRPLIDQQGHELVLDISDEPIVVDGDGTRLCQVFANLLNNAAKYTDRGGRIRLAVERQGSDAVVAVEDTGVGIPANMLGRVFEMFAQVDGSLERSQGGLGIGLNIVKRLVEMHGGSVRVASGGPGQGSTFTVRLPVVLTPAAEPAAGSAAGSGPAARRRILIADDNPDGADSLAEMLELLGNEVRTAHDGLEAVAVAEAFRPDVILMDIGMPRLNGFDACRRIREQPWGKGVVMVACTGWGQDDDKQKSQDAGFNFHMVKPVDPAAFEKMLAGLLVTTG